MDKKKTTYNTIKNRKVYYNYFLEKDFTAGMVLKGSEVKAIRAGKANINEAYCTFQDGELYIKNMFISSDNNLMFSHPEMQDRKLLLTKKELRQIQKAISIKGYTIVPSKIIVGKYIKAEIHIARGKKDYDKRQSLKEKEYKLITYINQVNYIKFKKFR